MKRIIMAGAIAAAGLVWSTGASVASDDAGTTEAEVATTVETVPDTAEAPETTQVPATADAPDTPEVPEAAENPETPGTTEAPGTAEAPATTEEPGTAEAPETTLPDEEPGDRSDADQDRAAIERATAIVPFSAMTAGGPQLSLPVDTVVYGDYRSRTELASAPTGGFEGYECSVAAVARNQGSVHPENDLVVSSGGSSVTMFDVERAPGATTPANGSLTLGSDVTVTLVMGVHTVFSGGFDVTFDCEPPFVPERLRLTFIQECVQDGAPSGWTATWRIRNENEAPVAYRVTQAGGGFELEGEAPVGDSFFETPWGSRTLILRTLDGDGDQAAQEVKAGGNTNITAEQDPDKCGEPAEPTLRFDVLGPVCLSDVPSVRWSLIAEGVTADTATISFRDVDGNVVGTLTDQPLEGRAVWPGASDDPADWPGWRLEETTGRWVEDPSDAALRQDLTVIADVGPTATATVSYPEATSECANPPADDPDPQDPRDPVVTTPTPESPQEGLRSSSSATGRSLPSTGSDVTFTTLLIATVLVVLGGSALAVRRRARA